MKRAQNRQLLVLLAAALSLATAAASMADDIGLTVEWGPDQPRLHRLHLATATLEEVADLPDLTISAMDDGPDGLVYGLETRGIEPPRLIVLDPESGAADVIGELAIADPTGLAFSPDGQLWIVAGKSLHRIDRADATLLGSLTLDDGVVALAGSPEHLYGISALWHFWTIDTSNGELTYVTVLPQLFLAQFDADFDSSGSLWILGSAGGPIMGTVSTDLLEVPDLSSGQFIQVFHQTYTIGDEDPRSRINALAVIPGEAPVVEVPVLDGAGLALLVLLLGISGAVALRLRTTRAVRRDAGRRR